VTSLLLDAATVVGALAVIVTALGALFRWTPLRWVMRTLIGTPLSRWFRGEVAVVVEEALKPIKTELSFNSGRTIKDQVQYLTTCEQDRQAS
jgi:hypothetical protein